MRKWKKGSNLEARKNVKRTRSLTVWKSNREESCCTERPLEPTERVSTDSVAAGEKGSTGESRAAFATDYKFSSPSPFLERCSVLGNRVPCTELDSD
jgi:hypothetical protein